MSKFYSSFKQQVLKNSGLAESYSLYGKSVGITDTNEIYIDGNKIDIEVSTFEEAREYAKRYIQNSKVLEDIDNTIPEEKVAHYIRQYHNIEKITDTLIESYIELASSNMFTVDPVITAIKESRTSDIAGKLQYELSDGSIVAIDEATQELLNKLLSNKPEVVDYMRESKDNFIRIIREI
jgi:hypothetical protein